MRERFLILGATGVVGRQVLGLLRSAGHEAIGASRHVRGPGWVALDLVEPATHAPALAGITTVMLISLPGDEDAHLHALPLVQAMVTAGVRRVVVLSALGADQRPEFSLRKVERLVEQSGLQWTHVRPNFFMQMIALPPLSTEIVQCGTLSLPLGDAKVAYVDANDVAATLFKALTDPTLAARAIALSGPEALDHHAIVASIAGRTGTPVRYVSLREDAARDMMTVRGFAPRHVERVLQFYALVRNGFCASPDTEVAQLLGRPLGQWSDFTAANAALWARAQAPT